MSAIELLEKAAGHLRDRAATYDKPEGERSIGAAVKAFNAITGDGEMNSEERGWLFMAILKMVRSQQGNYRADNYEDLAAYSALMGEAACEERNGGWTPEAINEAAFKDAYKEYTLQEVLGGSAVPDWVRWVAVTKCGMVVFASREPELYIDSDQWKFVGKYGVFNKVVPPISFKNCIWEVNVKPDCEYTLEQVIGESDLSDWARWVAVDGDGEVYEYSVRPFIGSFPDGWTNSKGSDWGYIKDIEPPADFTKCIWEVKK